MRYLVLMVSLLVANLWAQMTEVTIPLSHSDLYNERGFYKSTARMSDLNETISEFNGNLNFSIPLFTIKGKNGFDANLSLNYNGSMSYSVFVKNKTEQDKTIINFNGPGWVLSLNGIAIQTFNFETTWLSSTVQDNVPCGTEQIGTYLTEKGWVSLLTNGYHFTDQNSGVLSQLKVNKINLLMGDGSLLTLANKDSTLGANFNVGFSGVYIPDAIDTYEKAYVRYAPIQTQLTGYDSLYRGDYNRILYLYRGDGTTIEYRERRADLFLYHIPNYGIRLQQFFPTQIRDNTGNTIFITYHEDIFSQIGQVIGNEYKALGRPLVKFILFNNALMEFEYIVDELTQSLSGIVISYGGRKYKIFLEDFNGGPLDFPLISPENWEQVSQSNRIRNQDRGALGYVTALQDPEGRWYNFQYQLYYRNGYHQNQDAVQQVNGQWSPNKFHIPFRRISEIQYPEGRKSKFVYWEDANPLPANDGSKCYTGTGARLEDVYLKFLDNTGPDGKPYNMYYDSSPYLCDGSGNGGIGRDPFFTNIVYERTVYDGSTPIRRNRFNFDWFNYNPHSMPTWSGDQGLDYEDIYYSEDTLFAYENNNWVVRKRTKFTYRQAHYKNRSYYSPDIGRKVLLKSVKHYDGLSSTPFDTVGYVYNREPAHPSTDYHFQKVREERMVNNLSSGVSTWSYTMAPDSMNFSRIEETDPLGRFTVNEFLTDYIPLNDSASITLNTFYKNNLTRKTWTHPDNQSLNDTLNLTINSYYSDREKSEFKFLTTVWYVDADSLFKAYSDTFFYQSGELLVSYQNLNQSSPSLTYTASEGEIYHQPHIGFDNSFPDTLTSLNNVSSVKLKFYVYYVLYPENARPTEVYEITGSWDPNDPEYPMITVSSVPLTTVIVDSEGWYEIDLTSQYNAWKNDPANNPFYGLRFTMPPDHDSTTYAYKIRRDQYYPQQEETMMRLEVLMNNGADTLLYTTYSGFKSPFAGAPGQLKSTFQKNFSQGIAGKQQSFLYNVLAGGNLYQLTDNNGNRIQYYTDLYNVQAKVVKNDGQAFDTLFSRVYNPNIPPETRVYPDPNNSSEYLNIISLVDAYGIPRYSIDANNIFYEYRGDKLNRITRIIYPYDFQGRQLTSENTTENYSTQLLLKSTHDENNDVWTHFAYTTASSFQVGRSYDPVKGSFEKRAYFKFSNLDSLNITNVVSAKLWIYCNTVGYLSNGYILRLASVQDQWDENYNNSQGSPTIGTYGTSTTNDLGIQPGWNQIDISSWFENYYNSNERDNGLCLYTYQTIPTNPGNQNDYFEFSYEGDFAPKLEITATFSKWIDPGYTLKMEYHDSTNRLIAFNKQAMPDSATIIDSKSESIYDGLGRITETRSYYDDANYYATLTGYTYADQVDSVRNANGHTTRNSYDFLNRLTRTTFADGNYTRRGYGYTNTLGAAYNPVSNPDHFLNEIPAGTFFEVDTTIDELGRIKLSYSDAVGNLRQEILDPGGLNLTTNYYYNALYQQVRVEKPEGDDVRYRYNSFGELLRRESPDAGVTEYHYDPNGNLRFTQDANLRAAAKVLYTGYDGLNRPTITGIAAGTDSAAFAALRGDSTYSFEGDTANWISVNRYDKTPDPSAYPWNQYDITGVVGQMGNLKGRLAANAFRSGASALADDDTLTGQYGSAASFTARQTLTTGNPFEVTAPNGNVTLKAGQKITLKPGFHAHSGSRFSAAIDTALLNAPQTGKQWQLELYSYDYRGRVEKKWVFNDGLPTVTYSYEYNSQNALTKTTVQVGTESFYHFYEYDRLGQLVKVYTSTDGSKPAQADVVYTYNPVGAVDTLRYGEQPGGGFTVELPYQYNLREWLTDIADVSSGAAPFAAKYSYFANGNIQESEYRNSGSPMEQRYKYGYGYDNANRLLSADYQYYSGGWQNPARFDVSGLQYDGNGNILALNRKKEDNSTIDNLTYAYIAGTNKLASVTDAVSTTPEDWDAEDTQFTYDGNGNVIEMLENGQPAISSIQYDHRNLPTSLLNRNGDLVTYRYNASGQRVYKKVGSQTPEYYILDGDQTVAVYENGAVKYWNILANGVVGRRDAGGNKFYYIKDHLGSTRAVVDGSGNVKEALDYYSFGLLMPGRIYQSGSETKEKFTGKERDSETGLDYFGARYYSPALGRWLAVDPRGENYPSLSSFVYSANNPVRFIDPDGMYLYDASSFKRINAWKAFELLKEGIRARYQANPEKSYIGFYEKADFFDWFDPGWRRSASIMHGSTIEFTKDVIGDLSEVNVTVSPNISSLISEISVFKDKANSNANVEIWVINIYNDKGEQIAHISGTKEQIKKFLSEFGRDLKSGNVLSYKDEEKWKKLEEWDLEGFKKETKDSGDTGYEAKYGSPPR